MLVGGEKRVVYSADLGGQERFWNLWIEDMVTRGVEAVVYVFDDRAFKEEMLVFNNSLDFVI